MRVLQQKHNASSTKPHPSAVGASVRQTRAPQHPPLVQQLSRIGNGANGSSHAAVLNRAPAHHSSANQGLLLHLQRQYGNRYVNQVISQAQQKGNTSGQPSPLQTKMTIGPVGDKYEREADHTAAQVVQRINAPTPLQSGPGQAIQREEVPEDELQKKPQITPIQRQDMPGEREEDEEDKLAQKKPDPQLEEEKKEDELAQMKPDSKLEEEDDKLAQKKPDPQLEEEEKEDKLAQMKPVVQRRSSEGGGNATANVESSIKQTRGKGRPLPERMRGSMEQAFGADFSGVRVHTDSHANQINRSIQARAFTTGQDVFFRQGEFALGSKRGQELLAHELTHVVQQNGSAVRPKSLTQKENTDKTTDNRSKLKNKRQSAEPTSLAPDQASHSVADKRRAKRKGKSSRRKSSEGAAPTSPKADPAFQEVVNQSRKVAKQEKAHQPPRQKAQEAQEAAHPPANEVESKAQGRQVSEKMEQAETPPFDATTFKAALMERIQQITPSNMDEMERFKDSNQLTSVKNDMTGKVDEAQAESQGPLEEKAQENPDPSGIEPKQVTPLPPNDPGPSPPDIGGAKAAPKSKGYGEIEAPLQQHSQQLDQKLAAADITEEQLAKSNEPEFQAALEAKTQAQTNAVEAPKGYRQFEGNKLAEARSEAGATTQASLQGMHGKRISSLGQVTGKQQAGKGKDEEARTKIAADLQQIYSKTKTSVENILNSLDGEVDRIFDAGATEAKQTFEDYVAQRMEAYKAKRYSSTSELGPRIGGSFKDQEAQDFATASVLGHDLFYGLPEEVNRFYEEGRDKYLEKMYAVIEQIAELVATKLNEAKAEVTSGKQQVDDYVKQLPKDLQQIGATTAEDILGQFNELEQQINSKQDELIDRLAQKYKENLDAIDARIKEMQEENKGLIAKAIDFIAGVIQTIAELGKLLFNVLARAASAIPTILKDPIGFVGNLVSALKQGFENFVANIQKHLTQGLMSWLTGTLASAGVQVPDTFDVQGIFGLVMQLLGMTYDTIRASAVKRLGAEKVSYLEKNFELFRILATQGLAGLWQVLKDKIGDVKAMVLDPIQNFIIEQVIKGGIQWILSMLNPASAFIKACQAIVQIVQFFMDNAQRIADLINSIVDAVLAIANGAIKQAVQGVENALATAIPLVIDFLAKLLGLGNIGQKVQAIIQKLRQPVENAVNWVINQGMKAYKKVSNKLKKSKLGKKFGAFKKKAKQKLKAAKQWGKNKQKVAKQWFEQKKGVVKDKYKKTRKKGKEKAAAVVGWWKARKQFKAKDGETHTLYFKGTDRNATLMIASSAKPYTDFLDWVEKNNNNNLTNDQVNAIGKAREVVQRIKKRKSDDDTQQKEIERILGDLRKKTAILFDTNLPDCCLENRGLTFEGLTQQGYGTKMTARYLTHKNIPEGSTPDVNSTNFDSLNKRRIPAKKTEEKDSSYYIKGHLLNDNLGGTGKEWKNLTPLTRKANANHEVQIESFVKAAVDSGAMVKYKVEAVYSGQGNGPTKDELMKNRNITDDNDSVLAVLMEVIKAEEQVPSKLECCAKIVDPATKNAIKEKKETILNKVNRTIDSYTIAGEPKQPLAEQAYITKANVDDLPPRPPSSRKKQKVDYREN